MIKQTNKIGWCKQQLKGIELIEPNDNLSQAYFKDAELSLNSIAGSQGMWKTVISYYSCYYALYALLMKAGIKCEIHDCTLELMTLFHFSEENINFMKSLKKERIEVQYYRKHPSELELLQIKRFIYDCKLIDQKLTDSEIEKLRREVKNV